MDAFSAQQKDLERRERQQNPEIDAMEGIILGRQRLSVDQSLINGRCHPGRPLYDRCVADSFAPLRGTSATRGEVWAMELAKVPRSRAQP